MIKADTRHQLRGRAFQALLSMEFGRESAEAMHFAYWYDRENKAEVTAGFEVPEFMQHLTDGVSQHKAELDAILAPKLKAGWTMERLTLVEKTLLRLGLYEIQFYEGTPEKVAVNEAVELAKRFSDQQAARFINGVLTQFVHDET